MAVYWRAALAPSNILVGGKSLAAKYLKRYMLIAKSDLELLSAIFILLWPLRIVLPRALLSKFAKTGR